MNDPTPRRTREETRQLVLEAAVDLVRKDGLGAEPTTITYQKVFDHLQRTTGIRVTRASVHERIWENQREFQFDVILAANETETGVDHAQRAAPLALEDTRGQHPWDRLSELTRLLVAAGTEPLLEDDLYYSWTGITLALSRDRTLSSSHRDAAALAVRNEFEDVIEELQGIIKAVASEIGLRPRENLFTGDIDPWRFMAQIANAVSEGVAVASRFDRNALPEVELRTGPEGDLRTWIPTAVGYWAILRSLMEIDPEVHPDLAEEA